MMWFERICLWAQLFEKSVVYPMIFLSALTVDLESIKCLSHWRGSVILVVTALKIFRSAFSDCSKQYLILMLTILIFQYNPRTGIISGGVVEECETNLPKVRK